MLKRILISCAMTMLAACAGAPPSAPAAPATSHEPAEANSQSAADKLFAEEARGYKLVERNGKKFYCRSERASGSNITGMNCVSESELRARIEETEIYRRRPKPSVCASDDPRCGGS